MTINVTPIPKLLRLVAPAFTLGTANVAGQATTAVASDSVILAFEGLAKAWASFGIDATPDASLNVASISDGTGDWTISVTTDFAAGTYMTQNFLNRVAAGGDDYIAISDTANAVGSWVLLSWRISTQQKGETAEQINMAAAWGAQ